MRVLEVTTTYRGIVEIPFERIERVVLEPAWLSNYKILFYLKSGKICKLRSNRYEEIVKLDKVLRDEGIEMEIEGFPEIKTTRYW